jgi:hypothetical protein
LALHQIQDVAPQVPLCIDDIVDTQDSLVEMAAQLPDFGILGNAPFANNAGQHLALGAAIWRSVISCCLMR